MQEITQIEYDKIFSRVYNSGKFQYSQDIILWLRKKYKVVDKGVKQNE